MIITRTPYRVSFFGGGTDYHTWYQEHGGRVVSTTINHYNYISCRYLPPFHADMKNRIVWRELEQPETFEEIHHNAVRGALLHYQVPHGVEISNQCDLPTRSGLGSSSSFCAGLIKGIKALQGEMLSKYALAKETINLERNVLHENVGVQDQIAAVYGGLNLIYIKPNGEFKVEPVIISEARKKLFNDHLLLFFTGVSRTASDICKKQIETTKDKTAKLTRMMEMVPEACQILSSESADLNDFGKMLHETWMLKRSLTDQISNSLVEEIYDTALANGAIGGKLLGAGGGGFMLFFAPPEMHRGIKKSLRNLMHVPFKFDDQGCQIILYAPKTYKDSAYEKLDYIHMQNQTGEIKLKP